MILANCVVGAAVFATRASTIAARRATIASPSDLRVAILSSAEATFTFAVCVLREVPFLPFLPFISIIVRGVGWVAAMTWKGCLAIGMFRLSASAAVSKRTVMPQCRVGAERDLLTPPKTSITVTEGSPQPILQTVR